MKALFATIILALSTTAFAFEDDLKSMEAAAQVVHLNGEVCMVMKTQGVKDKSCDIFYRALERIQSIADAHAKAGTLEQLQAASRRKMSRNAVYKNRVTRAMQTLEKMEMYE